MAQATYKRGPIIYVTLPNNTGANLNVGDLVQDDGSNGIKALLDAGGGVNAFLGVCHEDIALAEEGVVEIPVMAVYEVELATGFNPAQLDPIYPAGSGEFDGGAGSDVVAGYIMDIDPASGATARAAMISEKLNPATHA